jgi:hypothetical protein
MTPDRGYVLGLDLSLTRAAAVLLPVAFTGDFREVQVAVAGHGLHNASTELERDARCVEVAETIEELVHGHRVVGAFVEGYAFSRAQQPHLGELRAVVRRALVKRYGWAPTPVSAGTARALFFGKTPKAPPNAKRDWLKAYILASVREVGAPFKRDDEADAFLVANYGLTEVGGVGLTIAPTPEALNAAVSEARLRTSRKRKRAA